MEDTHRNRHVYWEKSWRLSKARGLGMGCGLWRPGTQALVYKCVPLSAEQLWATVSFHALF